MRKLKRTLTIALICATTFGVASLRASENPTHARAKLQDFKKITIDGNVSVTLVSSNNFGIIYDDENSGNAKVLQKGNSIRITGLTKQVTAVTIYVKDIYRIEASDNVTIKTNGKLRTQYLQVYLRDNANAELEVNNNGMQAQLKGNSSIRLSGKTDDIQIEASESTKMSIDKLKWTNITSGEFVAYLYNAPDNNTLAQ